MDTTRSSNRVGLRILWSAALVLFFAVGTPVAFAQSPLRITFGGDEIGRFPSGWESKDKANMVKIYSVRAEGDVKFLHADASGTSVQIGYEQRWPLQEFPTLRWRWRAVLFPERSNELEKSGNDSVLGIYVMFSSFPVRVIKYIWSDTLPVGSFLESPHSSGTKMVVVCGGRELIGTWVTRERNVLEDYRRFFGASEKNPVAKGIGLLTDSDNTRSRAIGDYGDIEILSLSGRPGYSVVSPQK